MKFTDGLWLLREGVKPAFGMSVVKEDAKDDALNLHVATRPIRHRGDTLGGMRISSSFIPTTHSKYRSCLGHSNHFSFGGCRWCQHWSFCCTYAYALSMGNPFTQFVVQGKKKQGP